MDEEGRLVVWNRWYGGGEKVVEGGVDVALEVRVLRNRNYYEDRPGCMFSFHFVFDENLCQDRNGA